MIDEYGNDLHPDDILALLYDYLLRYRGWKDPAVRNLATMHRLDAIAENTDRSAMRCRWAFSISRLVLPGMRLLQGDDRRTECGLSKLKGVKQGDCMKPME